MSKVSTQNPWLFTFGLLGNIASFVVFLAPIPTFLRIFKKKSTEGFHSIPYIAAMFSAMLWLYYASHKSNTFLLIKINSIGCFLETIYIVMYITFAPKKAKRFTLISFIMINFVGFGSITLITELCIKASYRVTVLGWICMVLSISLFGAPLSVMRLVIRTRSVEFMPFYLSFFVTLSAIMWLFYGLLLKDLYIVVPNILGFVLGILQMLLYVIYKYFLAVHVRPNNELHRSDLEAVTPSKTTNVEAQQTQSPRAQKGETEHDQSISNVNQCDIETN